MQSQHEPRWGPRIVAGRDVERVRLELAAVSGVGVDVLPFAELEAAREDANLHTGRRHRARVSSGSKSGEVDVMRILCRLLVADRCGLVRVGRGIAGADRLVEAEAEVEDADRVWIDTAGAAGRIGVRILLW